MKILEKTSHSTGSSTTSCAGTMRGFAKKQKLPKKERNRKGRGQDRLLLGARRIEEKIKTKMAKETKGKSSLRDACELPRSSI